MNGTNYVVGVIVFSRPPLSLLQQNERCMPVREMERRLVSSISPFPTTAWTKSGPPAA